MEKKNYRFYVKGQIVPSKIGERVLDASSLECVRKYFSAVYISEFLTLINGIRCREKNYNQVAQRGNLLIFDPDDDCQQLPYWHKAALERPIEEKEILRLQTIFLPKEAQDIILRSRRKILIGTLLWMAGNVKQTWFEVFNHLPDVFSDSLKRLL